MDERRKTWYGRHINGDADFTISRLARLRKLYRTKTQLPGELLQKGKPVRLTFTRHRKLEEHLIQEGYGATNKKISDKRLGLNEEPNSNHE